MGAETGECSKGTYKVNAPKTYFYDQPSLKSKPRKAYLLKGDVVSCGRQTANFVLVYFTNAKDQSTEGFVLKKDLAVIMEPQVIAE